MHAQAHAAPSSWGLGACLRSPGAAMTQKCGPRPGRTPAVPRLPLHPALLPGPAHQPRSLRSPADLASVSVARCSAVTTPPVTHP